jgi:dTDP-4-dehydrorhamnose 3,5-epimerase
MKVIETALKDVLILEPKVFGDERGFFFESWNQNTFKEVAGVNERFVQDNHSKSQKGVLRGLHYQLEQSQGKLVRTVTGVVLDVVVDLRKSSATFGEHITVELSAESHHQLWIPAGFAHGFVVLSESADFLYKTTNYYAPQHEQCIRWDDPDLGIDWKLKDFSLSLSEKDKQGNSFREATYF